MTLTLTLTRPTPHHARARTPLHAISHATARGFDTGLAMIRIVRIARPARQDDMVGYPEL